MTKCSATPCGRGIETGSALFSCDLESRILQTNSVYELAGRLRKSAKDFVPFFEQWEETLPLAKGEKSFDRCKLRRSKAELAKWNGASWGTGASCRAGESGIRLPQSKAG